LVQLEPLVLPAVSSLQKTFLASTDWKKESLDCWKTLCIVCGMFIWREEDQMQINYRGT
jgi:hypothetical protein